MDRVRGVEGATVAMGKEAMMMERRWRRWGGDGGGEGGGPVATNVHGDGGGAGEDGSGEGVEQREPQQGR